jgi:disulfide oxidoreductase YuzD
MSNINTPVCGNKKKMHWIEGIFKREYPQSSFDIEYISPEKSVYKMVTDKYTT